MALDELSESEMKMVEGGQAPAGKTLGNGKTLGSITPVYLKRTGQGQDTAMYAQNGNLVVDDPAAFNANK